MSEMSIEELVKEAVEDIKEQVFLNRGTRVSNELQNRRHADIAWPGQWQGLQGAGDKADLYSFSPGRSSCRQNRRIQGIMDTFYHHRRSNCHITDRQQVKKPAHIF